MTALRQKRPFERSHLLDPPLLRLKRRRARPDPQNDIRSSWLGSPLDYQSASLFQRSGIQYCARYLATRISFEGAGVISALNMKFTAGYSFKADRFALLEIQDRPRSRPFCTQIPAVE